METICKLEKINVNAIKIIHRRSNCYTINICKYRALRKKLLSKAQNFGSRKCYCILIKRLVHVGKKLEIKLQYFDRYLYNKNIWEYALLVTDDGRFMIFDIECHSNNNIYSCFVSIRTYCLRISENVLFLKEILNSFILKI